jgi:hypothetical protein
MASPLKLSFVLGFLLAGCAQDVVLGEFVPSPEEEGPSGGSPSSSDDSASGGRTHGDDEHEEEEGEGGEDDADEDEGTGEPVEPGSGGSA